MVTHLMTLATSSSAMTEVPSIPPSSSIIYIKLIYLSCSTVMILGLQSTTEYSWWGMESETAPPTGSSGIPGGRTGGRTATFSSLLSTTTATS
jgi:hypothetical protein